MSDFVQSAKGLIQNNERLKTIGWFAAGIAFVFLGLSNFCDGYSWTITDDGDRVMAGGYAWMAFQILAGVSFTAAGGALFWSERVKCAIVIALAGLFGLFLGKIGKDFCLAVVYVSSTIYFWKTKLRIKTLVAAVVLIVLHIYSYVSGSARETSAWIISPIQLVLGLFFASKNAYAAAILNKIKDKSIAILNKIKDKSIVAKDIAIQYFRKYGAILLAYLKPRLKPFGKLQSSYYKGGYRVCFVYGCSVFVLGIICFAVLIFWASPGTVHLDASEVKFNKWNLCFIVSAITQLVACAIWGCFLFSQLSLARKLHEKQITVGSAPEHMLVARCFFVVLAVLIAVGVAFLLFEDTQIDSKEDHWTTFLTMSSIPLGVSMARHCSPKVAITLSSLVAIWHLLGASFVVALVRDNIAKVLSMESTSDNKAEIS